MIMDFLFLSYFKKFRMDMSSAKKRFVRVRVAAATVTSCCNRTRAPPHPNVANNAKVNKK
jgi:hypothetical protein